MAARVTRLEELVERLRLEIEALKTGSLTGADERS
jgi:hypothetical protein